MIATTQALSFSLFPPFSTTLVCVCSTVLVEFPNHSQEFPKLPTPEVGPGGECTPILSALQAYFTMYEELRTW